MTTAVLQAPVPIFWHETIVHSVGEGANIPIPPGKARATISDMVFNKGFLKENWNNKDFVISAKDAVDSDGKLLGVGWYKINRKGGTITASTSDGIKDLYWLDRLYISEGAAEIIKKTKEDGEERLLAFNVHGFIFYGVGLGVSFGFFGRGPGARVAFVERAEKRVMDDAVPSELFETARPK
jgi:hypothetical protein